MNIRNILLLALLFITFGCNQNKRHPVPYYSFDVNINLTLPSYSNLQGVGGWAYVSGAGSKGLVIYRQSISHFIAFDRHSPDDESGTCESGLVVDDENFLVLNDPCSGSKYSLYDGSAIESESKWGLRAYEVSYNGGDGLRIFNP